MICTTMNYNKQNETTSKMGTKGPSPIKPPRAIKETCVKDGSPTYSLFESNSPSQHWFMSIETHNNSIARKHSVSVDGSDSPNCTNYENNDAGFWRRASLPNNYFFMMSSYSCSVCNLPYCFNTDFLQTNCGHSVCKGCVDSNILSCPLCLVKTKQNSGSPLSVVYSTPQKPDVFFHPLMKQDDELLFEVPERNDSFSNLSPSSQLIYPEEEDEAFYIGDLLLSKSFDVPFTTDQTDSPLCCVKMTNIPWDVSQKDVKAFFGNHVELPCSSTYAQSIHIMMDRATGKTLSHCYVEFATIQQALWAIQYGNQRLMKGRTVNVTLCPMDELLSLTFPNWKSGFTGSKANQSFAPNSTSNCFVSREEINSLLVICKNYKLHFSRKCAERPFENIISIVTKLPWEQLDLVSSSQRDEIFDLLKSAIDALKIHLAKEFIQIDRSLLNRMIRAGLLCPGFTDSQKSILHQTADIIMCPADTKSLEPQNQANLISRKQQHAIGDIDTHLENSYVHIIQNETTNHSQNISSLLNILNQSAPNNVEPKEDEFSKNELSSLFVNSDIRQDASCDNYKKLCESGSSNGSSIGSSGSESDEDSYCFCEKEEDNEEEFLFF